MLQCLKCNGSGRVYHPDWLEYFQLISEKMHDGINVDSDLDFPAAPLIIECPICHGTGLVKDYDEIDENWEEF